MREVDTRTLHDGSQTTITLFASEDGRFVIEARNANGSSAVVAERHEAARIFKHPFSRSDWLEYPGVTRSKVEAGLALAEARAQEHAA